jgi:glycosyltransferase involved in cell wall biosynthesis
MKGLRKLFRQIASHPPTWLFRHYFYASRKRVFSGIYTVSEYRKDPHRTKAIIFDPGLRASDGHHLEHAQLMAAELSKTFTVSIYGNFWAQTRIIVPLRARPVCYASLYSKSTHENFDLVYRDATQEIARDLSEVRSGDLIPSSIFIIHTITAFQLEGLANWYKALASRNRPKLFLQFQFPLEFGAEEQNWPQLLDRARAAASALTEAGTVRFATNSDSLAERIRVQLDQPVTIMPMSKSWPTAAHMPKPMPGPVFGCFGGLRTEKGWQLLSKAIPIFVARHQDVRFIIQAPTDGSEAEAIPAIRALAHLPRVELINRTFDSKDDYFAALSRTRCILLPYDPTQYAARTSGILVEALGLGRLIITTDHTWLAAELRKHKTEGFVMANFAVPDLLDCLEAARDRLIHTITEPRIDRDLIASNNPESYCALLIRLMAETPQTGEPTAAQVGLERAPTHRELAS